MRPTMLEVGRRHIEQLEMLVVLLSYQYCQVLGRSDIKVVRLCGRSTKLMQGIG